MASSNTSPQRMVQNFHLVWLDANIDEVNNDDCRNSITLLRQVVNTVNTFVDVDKCIDFINQIKEEKTFMIFSGALGETTVPVVHEKPQVNTIYIFCGNKSRHEKWAKAWPKIQGVFTDIKPMCKALKGAVKDCDHNAVSISFVKKTSGTSKGSLDSLDSSFMYTQILKEILLTIDFEDVHIEEFLSFCREEFVSNNTELKNVERIAKEYHRHRPIWWYTCESFLYSMVNRALRLMDVDLTIKMGFFLKDVHNHIVTLHSEQFADHQNSSSFAVYRGQGLSPMAFVELQQTQGSLLAFNNFLSTSTNRDVSLGFAQRTISTSNIVGVLFVIEIDSKISTTPFANVKNVSYYKREDEILFSMHSVFRIGQIKQLDGNARLWQVNLTLTSDNDPQLQKLTEYIREETFLDGKGWRRLGELLIKLSQFDKAEEVFNILLRQTTHEREKEIIYHTLGIIKHEQSQYEDAANYYEQSIEIRQKYPTPDNSNFASSYNNLGALYKNMGQYLKALSYYGKALEIDQKTLPDNHPSIATCYNNIGEVYNNMGQYPKALSYYEKALEIWTKTLPENHPTLAISYSSIGFAYSNMKEYPKALSFHEKALEIRRKTLPENHPHLAQSYHNIGLIYLNMGEYSKALSYYEKSLEILQKTLPENHPHFASSYNNIGGVYDSMGEYSKALSYYEKALEIRQKVLPEGHPDLAISYHNIASLYKDMNNYRKALQYYERALDIKQRSLPPNHPSIKTVKENIEIVKKKL